MKGNKTYCRLLGCMSRCLMSASLPPGHIIFKAAAAAASSCFIFVIYKGGNSYTAVFVLQRFMFVFFSVIRWIVGCLFHSFIHPASQAASHPFPVSQPASLSASQSLSRVVHLMAKMLSGFCYLEALAAPPLCDFFWLCVNKKPLNQRQVDRQTTSQQPANAGPQRDQDRLRGREHKRCTNVG